MTSKPVAQVCLYGTQATGYAYLASLPGQSAIAAKGGWNADETRPTGRFRSLTAIIQRAKDDLHLLGVRRGDVVVFFPGGETCARTLLEEYEPVGDMRVERAPVMVVSAEAIERAAKPTRRTSPAYSRAELLGTTTSGKPVPRVPKELGRLERAASEAAGKHGLFGEGAGPAIHAAQAAQHAHFDRYAEGFTAADHRDAAKLIGDHKWANPEIDRYTRYAHNGLESRHRRAAEAIEQAAREEALRR